MKELSIEQKAKAYDEAIDKVAHFIKKHIGLGCIIHPNSSEAKELFNIFPELKESEDEKIRKEIISALKFANLKGVYDKHIAWLEKQGEQKLAWSEEDDIGLDDALWCCKQAASIAKDENDMGNTWYAEKWLKSLKQRIEE